MELTRLHINQHAVLRLALNPGVGNALEAVADRIVDKAKTNVNVGYAGFTEKPYPKRRTGDLYDSIHRTDAEPNGDELVVGVIADAEHRGAVYPIILRDRGWEFITDADLQSLKGA